MMIAVILLALACSDVTSGASVRDEMCGSSICLVDTTCCNWEPGPACCGYANAVCCSDGSCCPAGTTCPQEPGSKCSGQDGGSIASFKNLTRQEKLNNNVPSVEYILCPGRRYVCKSHQTCCETPSGQWGCCPYSQAMCCSDGLHCCPNGSTCTSGGCASSADKSLFWLKNTRSILKL